MFRDGRLEGFIFNRWESWEIAQGRVGNGELRIVTAGCLSSIQSFLLDDQTLFVAIIASLDDYLIELLGQERVRIG